MENEYIKTSNFKNLLFIFIILISLIACESKKKNIDFESRLSQNSNKDEDYLKFMNFIFAEKVNQDYTHCKKSAHFNDATSIFNLGAKYYKGEGVKQSYAIAIKYFKKASELGNCDATFNLGMMYYYGTGVRQDYAIAMKYYRKAAKQGNKIAMFHIAMMYKDGIGVKKISKKQINIVV